MKKLLITILMLTACSQARAERAVLITTTIPAQAKGPYFRILDPKHLQINAGASIHGNTTKPTTMLALITHNKADGYLIIPNVDWVPLAIGGGFKGGKIHASLGPSLNLLPTLKAGLSSFVNAVTPEDKYRNLKSLLEPAPNATGDISGALGVNLEYNFPGWTVPIFASASWKF